MTVTMTMLRNDSKIKIAQTILEKVGITVSWGKHGVACSTNEGICEWSILDKTEIMTNFHIPPICWLFNMLLTERLLSLEE